jgi:hypothetical protein
MSVSLLAAATIVAGLWIDLPNLSQGAQYALVQPLVETSLGTAVEFASITLAFVVGLVLMVTPVQLERARTGNDPIFPRQKLLVLGAPALPAIPSLVFSVIMRTVAGAASFDWVYRYLFVAMPTRLVLFWTMIAEAILLVLAIRIAWRTLTRPLQR